MPYLILIAVLFALAYAPSLWVKAVMRRHARERKDIPGTGAELATHLLKRFELDDVSVEQADAGDNHYDAANRVVRLSPENHDGRSLTAVAVAAHEVGHAIQFGRNEAISQLRERYGPTALMFRKTGILIMTLLPFVGILLRSPAALFALVALSIGLQLIGALLHLVILPLEWDASFNKALPILVDGEYIDTKDAEAVRHILKAAAFTYLAAALAEILNIGRWLMVLRR